MNGLYEAVLLVGGKGTRLQGVVADRPKPMAFVNGKPFAEWLLLALRLQNVRRVVLSVGHMADCVESDLGNGDRFGLEIVYARDPFPLDTGGALRNALNYLHSECFLALNGDSYCAFDVRRLLALHQALHAQATLWLTEEADSGRYGTVEIDAQGAVLAFHEKSATHQAGLINTGVYILERTAVEAIPADRAVSIEREFFPSLAGHGLYGLAKKGLFVDIGTPESYQAASQILHEELNLLARMNDLWERARVHLNASAEIKRRMADHVGTILEAAKLIAESFRSGNKVLLCGNGGSAADCQHMAAEFVSRLTKEFERPGLPAIALTTDTSFLTAFANDCGFEGIFERQVRALGKPGDVLIGISTSGNSTNVLRAVSVARELGIKTIGLVGEGGPLEALVDCAIAVPNRNTQYIQETLLSIEHILCDLTERILFAQGDNL